MRKTLIVGLTLVLLLLALAPAATAADSNDAPAVGVLELILDWLGLTDEGDPPADEIGPQLDPGG